MRIFITGANGFIGGSVAATLVTSGHEVHGLVRSEEKAEAVRAFGIVPVLGTLADCELLTKQAGASDAVINAASSDDRQAADTLIGALAGTGKTLIHTSGTSIVADEANGEPSDAVHAEGATIEPEPDKVARVALDRAVLEAPGIRSVVLCNSLIYGDALGPEAHSVQLPRLAAEARESGTAHYIGRGLNRWSTVHISDVASLYALALEQAPSGTFAYVESGESSFRDMAEAMAAGLGLDTSASMPSEDAEARWGRELAVFALGSNSRVRGQIGRDLGWSPEHRSAESWLRNAH